MTDRDLGALLERASEHLPELDFAEAAWSAALLARARRRRRWATGVGALAAATAAVLAVQLGTTPTPRPAPAASTSTAQRGTLPDGTAYDVMPPEGKEAQLPHFDSGLPSVIDLRATPRKLSTLRTPLASFVAVYLRTEGERYRPVLLGADGTQYVVDTLLLSAVHDDGGNSAAPLGARAIGGGYAVVFPQPGAVVKLDTRTGRTTRYAVPSETLEHAGWTADGGTVVARSSTQAWTIDPWAPGATAVPADSAAYEGRFRFGANADTRSTWVGRYGPSGALVDQRKVTAPVFDTWGDTLGTEQRAATGAFFDQDLVHQAVRMGGGPVYQGLLSASMEGDPSPVLLLAPENPDGQTGRQKGCCTVLGWADGKTVLFQANGSHGVWVLAWNVVTGEVFETARVLGASETTVLPPALNVGWRY